MTGLLGWIFGAGASVVAIVVAIPKDLWTRWRSRLVDRIDLSLRRRTTRFGQRYREHLLASLRFIDLKGLATVGFYTPELDEVFVDVTLAYRPPHLVKSDVLSEVPADVTDRHSIDEFLSYKEPIALVITGAPGSGKTTLLRHTARDISRRLRKHERQIPILLYLRDHVATIIEQPEVGIPDLVHTTLGSYSVDEPPGWFEQQLRNGNCVILLDGLDEVAHEDDRRRMSGWVERQTRLYPKNDFVITSRPHGYRSAPIAGAAVLQVRSFTEDQISRFIRGWYLAVEKRSTGISGDEIRMRANEASNNLLTKLRDAPALEDLTVNPLLLTMIANVHRYRGALPGSRSDLYGEICQVMLWRRAEAKDLPLYLSGDKKESLLRGLAFMMMQERVRDLPRAAVLREVDNALRRVSTSLTAADFLADATSSGLLLERESGVFSFAHLTFQEYLASAFIRDKGNVQILVDMVNDVWWRETTLLYAAKADADPIVEACLESGSIAALLLAFDCVDQGSELAPQLRDRLDNILGTTQTDPAMAKARAGLLIAQHLRRHIRTSQGTRVCANPVTNAIYALFVTDHPECTAWSPSQDSRSPVRGVDGKAAATFVRWVNQIIDGEPRYRLPSLAELNDEAVKRSLAKHSEVSIWAVTGTRRGRTLWVPLGNQPPNIVNYHTILQQVTQDLEAAIGQLRLLRARAIIFAMQVAFEQEALQPPQGLIDFQKTVEHRLQASSNLHSLLGLQYMALYESDAISTVRQTLGPVLAFSLRRAAERDLTRHPVDTLTKDLADSVETAFDRALRLAGSRREELDILVQVVCKAIMGQGLSPALRRALAKHQESAAELAEVLLTMSGISKEIYVPTEVLRTRRPPHNGIVMLWARDVVHELDMALQHLTEEQFLTEPDTARNIRLPALCLAAEEFGEEVDPAIHKWLLQVAAGATLIEQRVTGKSSATETIMLATM